MISVRQLKNNISKLPVRVKLFSEKIQRVVDGNQIPFVYTGVLVGYTDNDFGECSLHLIIGNNMHTIMQSSQFRAFKIIEEEPTNFTVPKHIKERFIHLWEDKNV